MNASCASPLPRGRSSLTGACVGRFIGACVGVIAALLVVPWVLAGFARGAPRAVVLGLGVLRALSFGVGLAASLLLASALEGRRLLPVPIGLARRASYGLFRLVWPLCRVMGCNDDDVRRAFLLLHNGLVWAWWTGRRPSRLLVLLPQCLDARLADRLTRILDGYACSWKVVRGGTEALGEVRAAAPDGMIAVACERDLLHGLMDVGTRVPWVFTVPNVRGDRPCHSTDLDLEALERILVRIALPRPRTDAQADTAVTICASHP